MRLRYRDTVQITRYQPEAAEDKYAGVSRTWVHAGTILAVVSPAENKRTVELYGERVVNMLQLTLEPCARLELGDGISRSGDAPTHIVVSTKEYSTHSTAIVERLV